MKFRVYGEVEDTKTGQPLTGVIVKLHLKKEELQQSKSAKNGFYELIAEIDASRIESGQQLLITFEMEGYQRQENLVLATEGSFNLDAKLEAAPPPKKSFNWLPVIIAGGVVLVVGVILFLILRPKAPKIISFSADPNSIESGHPAKLRWETKNAVNVQISPDVEGFDESDSEIDIYPSQTTTYTLIAKNKEGKEVKEAQIRVYIKDGYFEDDHFYEIIARHSGKCLDVTQVKEEIKTEPVSIIQYTCKDPYNKGSYNQLFKFESVGKGYYKIIARHSGKCLYVQEGSKSDHVNIIQNDCQGDNRQFSIEPVGKDYYKIIARHSGKCLEVQGGSKLDIANIQQNKWNDGNNQQFRFVAFVE